MIKGGSRNGTNNFGLIVKKGGEKEDDTTVVQHRGLMADGEARPRIQGQRMNQFVHIIVQSLRN